MRRHRKRRSPAGVSLFPFLAVLICTLGVLIVLLVIAVKAAESTADQTVAENQAEFERRKAELVSVRAIGWRDRSCRDCDPDMPALAGVGHRASHRPVFPRDCRTCRMRWFFAGDTGTGRHTGLGRPGLAQDVQ